MHEQAFAYAASQPPAAVLHLPLKPYSIGHEIELWRQDNPLLTKDRAEFDALSAVKQRDWLIRAVDFCSQDRDEWRESERTLQSCPRWWQWRARWKKNRLLATWNRWDAILQKLTEAEWIIAVAEFRNYLIAGRSCPPAPTESGYKYANGNPDTGGGRQLGSPIQARVLNFLAARPLLLAGRSVYDFPFGLALWLCFTDGEAAGTVAIENEAERAVDAKEKELLAEIAAERAAEQAQTKEPESCQP